VKELVADANIQGQVEYLVQRMQTDAWADSWQALDLVLYCFEEVGLSTSATDPEVWKVCRAEQLILITDQAHSRRSVGWRWPRIRRRSGGPRRAPRRWRATS